MRIAQVSPLYERVPPIQYGGTERVVSYLTEELVAQGHEVTLYASGDSVTSARLVSTVPRSLRTNASVQDSLAHHYVMLERVFRDYENFDLVHFHIDYLHFPLSRRYPLSQLTTLHGRLDLPDLKPLYQEFPSLPVVSISNSQRTPLPDLSWLGTVYHGLPSDLYLPSNSPGSYLAFLGRISPEKGLIRAIEIAERSGMPLKIAAKIDKADHEYYESLIRPLLAKSHFAEYIGEITDAEKNEFLGNASALLFPIDWPEPFGIVMIEAMACGTPVIAFRRGSVPEVMREGVNGFVVENVDEAVDAVSKLGSLSRTSCRESFDRRFTASRMAGDYLEVYDRLCVEKNLTAARGRDWRGRLGRHYSAEGSVLRPGNVVVS